MNWKRKGKELAGKNRRQMSVGSYRERKGTNNWEGKRWELVTRGGKRKGRSRN